MLRPARSESHDVVRNSIASKDTQSPCMHTGDCHGQALRCQEFSSTHDHAELAGTPVPGIECHASGEENRDRIGKDLGPRHARRRDTSVAKVTSHYK